jgi:hypothetical protein
MAANVKKAELWWPFSGHPVDVPAAHSWRRRTYAAQRCLAPHCPHKDEITQELSRTLYSYQPQRISLL